MGEADRGISVCWQNQGFHAYMAGPCLDTLAEAVAYRDRLDAAGETWWPQDRPLPSGMSGRENPEMSEITCTCATSDDRLDHPHADYCALMLDAAIPSTTSRCAVLIAEAAHDAISDAGGRCNHGPENEWRPWCEIAAGTALAQIAEEITQSTIPTISTGDEVIIDGWKYEVLREPGDDDPAYLRLVETDRPLAEPTDA